MQRHVPVAQPEITQIKISSELHYGNSIMGAQTDRLHISAPTTGSGACRIKIISLPVCIYIFRAVALGLASAV